MLPELFELPFIHLSVKSYGVMLVIGFLAAVLLMRKLARRIGENPDNITNTALYTLIVGVIGSRAFYVMHHFYLFRDDLPSVFAVWQGGLEFIGGIILAIIFILIYLPAKKLSIRKYMDILVIGLMLGLAFGRIGCYLNGCCFGATTKCPVSIRFPYGSYAYLNQAFPNPDRDRYEPLLDLPAEFFGQFDADTKTWIPAEGSTKYSYRLKPYSLLTDQQKNLVKEKYRLIPVHPSQFYSSANALLLCFILYLFWRKYALTLPGCTFALQLSIYGITRLLLEYIRDDNPFEDAWWVIYKGGTISQNIGIYLVILGTTLMALYIKFRPKTQTSTNP